MVFALGNVVIQAYIYLFATITTEGIMMVASGASLSPSG
jgi:hypothetical protein